MSHSKFYYYYFFSIYAKDVSQITNKNDVLSLVRELVNSGEHGTKDETVRYSPCNLFNRTVQKVCNAENGTNNVYCRKRARYCILVINCFISLKFCQIFFFFLQFNTFKNTSIWISFLIFVIGHIYTPRIDISFK